MPSVVVKTRVGKGFVFRAATGRAEQKIYDGNRDDGYRYDDDDLKIVSQQVVRRRGRFGEIFRGSRFRRGTGDPAPAWR